MIIEIQTTAVLVAVAVFFADCGMDEIPKKYEVMRIIIWRWCLILIVGIALVRIWS